MYNDMLKYGKTLSFKFLIGSPYIVNSADVDVAEHVLRTNFDNYIKDEHLKTVSQEFLG